MYGRAGRFTAKNGVWVPARAGPGGRQCYPAYDGVDATEPFGNWSDGGADAAPPWVYKCARHHVGPEVGPTLASYI